MARTVLLWLLLGCFSISFGAEPQPERIVFIGDSITDGNTYPLLVRQALSEAGQPVPVCINAGVAGDTAQGVRKRLERDVFVHKPTRIALSIGINDVLRKVSVEDYQKDVTAIVEQCRSAKIPMLLLTTTILGSKHAEAEQRLVEYNAVLRQLAEKHGCQVAEVNQWMREARKAGAKQLEPDEVHLTFHGYRIMARAVLDGLGFKEVAVPKELKTQLMPGVVASWQMLAVDAKEQPLDEASVKALKPDDSWKAYALPEKTPQAHWWFEQERQRGFALALDKVIGKGKSYRGLATLETDKPKTVYFNTGAQLQTIWLNGKRIYQADGWTGWHAGKERIAAPLQAGKNTIVIETGNDFFLSVTDDNAW